MKKIIFLIELFLKNENDKSNLYDILDKDFKTYSEAVDSSYKNRQAFYTKKKSELNWNKEFDAIAKAGVDF
ncbi:MAG: hypothetical protein HC854_08645, partial [Flavobacterium sp.]|nr:hypothetical protein [Flavobacterium sp.]